MADPEGSDPSDPTPDEETSGVDDSNVTVTEAGETEPAEPSWEKPDVDDIPEFETGGGPPMGTDGNPTAGKPNEARTPSTSRLGEHSTEAYVAAMEMCARLPEDIRLPAEAADLVPVAFEAELERNIQAFASAEFGNPTPHVEDLEFFETDGDVWLKFRLGAPTETFLDLSNRTDELREYALQELDSLF